jgi:hypothetical protein
VFVLKLWLKRAGADSADGPLPRGSLEPVGSVQVRYFAAIERLGELLAELTGWDLLVHGG